VFLQQQNQVVGMKQLAGILTLPPVDPTSGVNKGRSLKVTGKFIGEISSLSGAERQESTILSQVEGRIILQVIIGIKLGTAQN